MNNNWETLTNDEDDMFWKDGRYVLLYYGDENRIVISGNWDEQLNRWEPQALPSHGCGCCRYPNTLPTHVKELEIP